MSRIAQIWKALFDSLGEWFSGPDQTGNYRQVSFRRELSHSVTSVLGIFLGYAGAEYSRRAGYRLSALSELEVTLSNLNRILKSIRIVDRLSTEPAPQLKQVFSWTPALVEYLTVLAKAASFMLKDTDRILKADKSYTDGRPQPGHTFVGSAVPVSLAVIVSELEITLDVLARRAGEEQAQEQDVLEHLNQARRDIAAVSLNWFRDYQRDAEDGDILAESLEGLDLADELAASRETDLTEDEAARYRSGARGRARLLRILTRHHYPALSAMEAVKAVADDVFLFDGDRTNDLHQKRLDEAVEWLSGLIARESIYDAPMHFTPTKVAESCSLAVILQSDSHREIQNRFLSHALTYLGRANGSFSMGREYYANINRLYYLYDDFNDRARHSAHAQSMFCSDMLAIYSTLARDLRDGI
ncbi:MAG: hypothetical protein R3D85_05095 [Paracoccaceae bacterium]